MEPQPAALAEGARNNADFVIADYWAVKNTIEPAAVPMSRLLDMVSLKASATMFCTLDIFEASCQVSVGEDADNIYTMITTEGLFSPYRVPQGVLNAAKYCQVTVVQVLDG